MTTTARAARDDLRTQLARAGWAAKGVLYLVTGLIVSRVARGGGRSGGEDASQTGALREVAEQPFGKILLGVLAVGLLAYSLWRLVEAWLGDDAGSLERAAFVASGLVYAGLGVVAASMVLGGSGGSGGSGPSGGAEEQAQGVTATVLGWPFGPWLVAGAGVVLAAVGLVFVKRGVARDFMDDLDLTGESPGRHTAVEWAGVVGQCARGFVFAVIGWFLVQAAVQFDPDEAKGLDGALRELADTSHGTVLLWAVALGFAAYGLFSLARSRYDRNGR